MREKLKISSNLFIKFRKTSERVVALPEFISMTPDELVISHEDKMNYNCVVPNMGTPTAHGFSKSKVNKSVSKLDDILVESKTQNT